MTIQLFLRCANTAYSQRKHKMPNIKIIEISLDILKDMPVASRTMSGAFSRLLHSTAVFGAEPDSNHRQPPYSPDLIPCNFWIPLRFKTMPQTHHWRNSTMQQETPDLKQKKNSRNASSNDMTAAANMYVQKGSISRVTGLVFIQILFIINYCM